MRVIHHWSNCLIVAITLWCATRGRGWIAFRRSQGLRGLILHAAHGRDRQGGARFLWIDAIPPKRKSGPMDEGDSFILFPATYRATMYRRTAIGTGNTIRDAMRSMWSRDTCRHCHRKL